MILAIDVNNTNTVFAIFEKNEKLARNGVVLLLKKELQTNILFGLNHLWI